MEEDKRSDLSVARKAYSDGDFQRAREIWESQAKQGNAEAQAWLGSLYANGDGVVSDHEMAMRERMVLLENRDKKEDQQRHLVWFSAITVTLFIVVFGLELVFPVFSSA